MNNFYTNEIASEKIRKFVESRPNEFLGLLLQLDRMSKSIMGGFFDYDEHNGQQLFNEIVAKIEKGVRKWDYDKLKIEAIIYNSARSHLSSELKKKVNSKIKIVSLNKLADESNNNNEEVYYRDGVASNDEDNKDNNGSYEIQQIDDDTISEMIKKELPLIEGDIDLVSIEIMDLIKSGEATKQKDIADILKLTEKEVRNSIDRIKRAGNKVFNKLPEMEKQEIENYKIDYKIKDIKKHKLQENIQK